MAVNITPIDAASSTHRKVFDVEATADADTTADLAHNLFSAEEIAAGADNDDVKVTIEPQAAAARLSDWIVGSRDQGGTKTTVRLSKTTAVGSGAAGAQVRVYVERTHSLVK